MKCPFIKDIFVVFIINFITFQWNILFNPDSSFPYKELTLSKIGIPAWDVLHISAGQADYYVELADEYHYSETLFKREES